MNYMTVNTMGNFQSYDERYHLLCNLKKSEVDKIVIILNEKFPKSKLLDRNNPKDFNFDTISYEEVWSIAKKYSSGCSMENIADCIVSNREREYKRITGKYAEKAIKFPKSRIKDILDLLDKKVKG